MVHRIRKRRERKAREEEARDFDELQELSQAELADIPAQYLEGAELVSLTQFIDEKTAAGGWTADELLDELGQQRPLNEVIAEDYGDYVRPLYREHRAQYGEFNPLMAAVDALKAQKQTSLYSALEKATSG
jgi:hypothetical protein